MIEVRLDKWLWAARLFKTRPVAAKAIAGGHAEVNGSRAKPARMIRIGDKVLVRKGPYTYELTILGLAQRRGPASEAQALYVESESSIRGRERLAGELKTRAAQILYDPGKPSNRDRRNARSRKREQ